MRREGYEFALGRPQVILRTGARTGELLEPYEELVIDCGEEFTGPLIAAVGERRGELQPHRQATATARASSSRSRRGACSASGWSSCR